MPDDNDDEEQEDEPESKYDPDLWYKDRYLTGEESAGPWPCIKTLR